MNELNTEITKIVLKINTLGFSFEEIINEIES
jgi:hypothetical protein